MQTRVLARVWYIYLDCNNCLSFIIFPLKHNSRETNPQILERSPNSRDRDTESSERKTPLSGERARLSLGFMEAQREDSGARILSVLHVSLYHMWSQKFQFFSGEEVFFFFRRENCEFKLDAILIIV